MYYKIVEPEVISNVEYDDFSDDGEYRPKPVEDNDGNQ